MLNIKYNIIIIYSLFIANICNAQNIINSNNNSKLTLDIAMDIAEKNSASVKSSKQDLNYYEKSQTLSYFNLGPQLNASGNLSLYPGQNEKINQNQPDQTENLSLTLTQPLTGIAQSAFKISERNNLKNAAKNDLITERIKAREQAAEYFIKAQQAYRDVEIKKTTLVNMNEQLKETEILYESGDENKTKIDFLQMQTKHTETEIDLSKSENELKNRMAELKTFLGFDTNYNLALAYEEYSFWEKQNKQIDNLTSLISKGKKGRYELKSLAQKIEAEKDVFKQSAFEYLPKVNFFASYTRSDASQGSSQTNISSSLNPQTTINYGLNLTWNIWDGGIIADNQMNSLTKKEKLIIDRENTSLQINQDITIAYNNFKNNISILPKAKFAVETSEEAFKLSQIRYKSGSMTASELILIQNTLINSKINLAVLRSNIDISWLKLQASLGDIPKSNK